MGSSFSTDYYLYLKKQKLSSFVIWDRADKWHSMGLSFSDTTKKEERKSEKWDSLPGKMTIQYAAVNNNLEDIS